LEEGPWPERVIGFADTAGHDDIPRPPEESTMSRLSLAQHHDPYWDLDGSGARRSRHQRQFVRWTFRLIAILAIGVLLTRLPAIDATILATPAGRPILGAAIFSLLAAFVLLALAKIRHGSHD
jgi:hypothetical protein